MVHHLFLAEKKKYLPPKRRDGSTNTQQLPAWSPRACFALRARKWLGKGARSFALTFGLAQKQIARCSSQFICLPSSCDSRHAAGAHFGGCSAPLHSHPRIARIPFQATSGWGNVVGQFAIPDVALDSFQIEGKE